MEKDAEIKGEGNSYDFGARMYDSRIGRWLSRDPRSIDYPFQSDYIYSSNSPIFKIDIEGEWDVVIHSFGDRGKMGYAIATVKTDAGEVIGEYLVRVVGSAGVKGRKNGQEDKNLRVIPNGDTPTGTYSIEDWWGSNKSTKNAYGPNRRLVITGRDGEITEGSNERKTTIRMHGGRQEIGHEGNFDPDNVLKYTNGCIRISDNDILEIYNTTKQLMSDNPDEEYGTFTVIDDLVNLNGEFYLPEIGNRILELTNDIANLKDDVEIGNLPAIIQTREKTAELQDLSNKSLNKKIKNAEKGE